MSAVLTQVSRETFSKVDHFDLGLQLERGSSSIVLPPQSPVLTGRPTLVLDLDETLAHSSIDPNLPSDLVISVEIDRDTCEFYVRLRPFLAEFLRAAADVWEVVVFTASVREYADELLNKIDPNGEMIHHRLFREHCTYTSGMYVKDLKRLGRELMRTVIVDNSPIAYWFHPKHALPVTSWFDDGGDTELRDLLGVLSNLAVSSNVTVLLQEAFPHLHDEGCSETAVTEPELQWSGWYE